MGMPAIHIPNGNAITLGYPQDLDQYHIIRNLSVGFYIRIGANAGGFGFPGCILHHGFNGAATSVNQAFFFEVLGSADSWDIRYIHENSGGGDIDTTVTYDFNNDVWYYVGFTRHSNGKIAHFYWGDGYNLFLKSTVTYTNDPDGGTDASSELRLFRNGSETQSYLDDCSLSNVIIVKDDWTCFQHREYMRSLYVANKSYVAYYNPFVNTNDPNIDLSNSALGGAWAGGGASNRTLVDGPSIAVQQPSYVIWRRNRLTKIAPLELTKTTSSDLENWGDAIDFNVSDVGEITENISDNLNNWAQAVSVGIPELSAVVSSDLDSWNDSSNLLVTLLKSITDSINFWDDSIHPVYSVGRSASDTLTFSDAISILTLGFNTVDVSDDLDNWSDNVELLNDLILKVNDTLDRYRDNVELLYVIRQELEDDLDNWSDSASKTLLLELTKSVSSTLNSWDDNVVREFLTRLARNKHSLLTGYIRRYLNDPKEPITKDLRVEASDSNANNWQDSNA